jgi:hypothetical protein
LSDRKFPDWNDELRSENRKFGIHPFTASFDFAAIRNTISPFRVFPREAAADGGHVDMFSEFVFLQPDLAKPTK